MGTVDGTGKDTVVYAVSENSGKNRSGKILVAGIDPVKHIPTAKKTYTVAQKGGNTVNIWRQKADFHENLRVRLSDRQFAGELKLF